MVKSNKGSLDSPTAWFCELEQAIRSSDREREMTARRELARLGVLVTIDARSVLALPEHPAVADRPERSS
jgi:hypothetical protein